MAKSKTIENVNKESRLGFTKRKWNSGKRKINRVPLKGPQSNDIHPKNDFTRKIDQPKYVGVRKQPEGLLTTSFNKPTKVYISNLHYNVSELDLKLLFGECGRVRKVILHFDQNGRPRGSAEIIYERRSDAEKAVVQFNGVRLDGRIMHVSADLTIEIEQRINTINVRTMPNSRRSLANTRGTGKVKNFSQKKVPYQEMNNKRVSAKYFNKKKTQKAKPVTVEELDAEMDEYNRQRDV